jgi:hypothetical protein
VHVGNIGFNAILGAVLAGAFHHNDNAAITALAGTAIGEIQTLSCPTEAVKALRRYRAGDLSLHEERSRALTVVPRAWPGGAGLGVQLAF